MEGIFKFDSKLQQEGSFQGTRDHDACGLWGLGPPQRRKTKNLLPFGIAILC